MTPFSNFAALAGYVETEPSGAPIAMLTSRPLSDTSREPRSTVASKSGSVRSAGAERTNADRMQAVHDRDRAADGSFVFAVTSTGVFCRPSCPARRPRPENVRFFDDNAAAKAAGFRACKRCQPEQVLLIDQAVGRVRELLDAADGEAVSLATLAKATGLSPFHLQREFKRRVGLTPKQYSLARRTERLRREIPRTRTLLDAGFEAGFGSSARLYADSSRRLGMTPGRCKNGGDGIEIRYAVGPTPVGAALVASTERGICAVRLGSSREALERDLARDFPHATLRRDAKRLKPFLDAVRSRIDRVSELALPTDLQGTAFQAQVWEELRRIPSGETRSYAQIAQAIGRPSAVRAVARACASNPVALVVPCHRVVGSDGSLTGYRWGVQRKRALLDREAAESAS